MDFSAQPQIRKILQDRLRILVVLFIFFFTLALTLAPYTKTADWNQYPNWQPWLGFSIWLICFFLSDQNARQSLPKRDLFMLPIAFLLIGWGLLTIFRLSIGLGLRQTIWLAIGTIGINLIVRYPRLYDLIRRYRIVWLVLMLILIALTLLPGVLLQNDQPILWLTIGSLNLQPSEPLKLALLIYLAGYFASRPSLDFRKWQTLMPTIFILLVCAALLILQRDLGTATLIFTLYVFIIFTITPRRRILIISLVGLIITAVVGSLLFDVIRWRAEAWINPWLDPTARSYQIVQSLMAAASGGLFGTGPGMGAPGLVPVAVSDFIFVAIFEETGLLGAAGLLVLMLLFFSRTIYASRNAADPFSAILAGGLGLLFAIQSLLIIGGNIRLFPLTGVTLPLVSYGGSSLVISMIAVGILLRISNPGGVDIQSETIFTSLKRSVFPIIASAFIAALILCAYWSVIRKDTLLARGDNLRGLRANQFVPRGEIQDNHGTVISGNSGSSGSYSRIYPITSLGATVGYQSTTYGLSGLEASMDPYLRGTTGYSGVMIWWRYLLTSLPPDGLDLRLTIDHEPQSKLNDLLSDRAGSGVVLNAQTGEILALLSAPTFDANNLAEEWDSLVIDPKKPLFNRAMDGRYSAGTTVGVFLLAEQYEQNKSILDLNTDPLTYQGRSIECSALHPESATITSKEVVQSSCPQTNFSIAKGLTAPLVYSLYKKLGFYSAIDLSLSTPGINDPGEVQNIKTAAIGQENLTVSPLHMALAAASISSNGNLPTAKLILSYQTPDGKWELFDTDSTTKRVFSSRTVGTIQQITELDDLPAWGVVGRALSGKNQIVSWFIGGTNATWQGIPMSTAILIEENNPNDALRIGRQMLEALINQSN